MKLFIGLPIYSQVPSQFVQCLLALQAAKPNFKKSFGDDFAMEWHMCQGDGIARSRNQLSAAFLKTDCTHMLMIDCDILFSPEAVAKLLSRDKDVIGGFYPKKQQGNLEWVINTFADKTDPMTPEGLQRVAYIGTGFMMIKRRVFDLMRERWPEIRYQADYGRREIEHDFWSMAVHGPGSAAGRIDAARGILALDELSGPEKIERITAILNGKIPDDNLGRYLSEDWFFCQRWLELGGEVWGDCCVALKHIGPVVFPLDTQLPQMLEPNGSQPMNAPDNSPLEVHDFDSTEVPKDNSAYNPNEVVPRYGYEMTR